MKMQRSIQSGSCARSSASLCEVHTTNHYHNHQSTKALSAHPQSFPRALLLGGEGFEVKQSILSPSRVHISAFAVECCFICKRGESKSRSQRDFWVRSSVCFTLTVFGRNTIVFTIANIAHYAIICLSMAYKVIASSPGSINPNPTGPPYPPPAPFLTGLPCPLSLCTLAPMPLSTPVLTLPTSIGSASISHSSCSSIPSSSASSAFWPPSTSPSPKPTLFTFVLLR